MHTPAPWTHWFNKDESGLIVMAGVDTGDRVAGIAEIGITIRTDNIDHDSIEQTNERIMADLLLIAAAPDLLDNLKCAVWYWEQNFPADAGPTEHDDLKAAQSILHRVDTSYRQGHTA